MQSCAVRSSGGRGSGTTGEIAGRTDPRHPHLRSDRHRDHVLGDLFAEPDAGIVARRDDVDEAGVDGQFDPDVGMPRQDPPEGGQQDPFDRILTGGDAEDAGRRLAEFAERFAPKVPETIDPAGAAPLLCAGITIDTVPYVPTLATDGTLVLVGCLGPREPALNTVPMVMARKAVTGSLIGGIRDTQEMLDFCGAHGIGADVEVIRMHDIDTAFARLKKADVKCRFVIDMATLHA